MRLRLRDQWYGDSQHSGIVHCSSDEMEFIQAHFQQKGSISRGVSFKSQIEVFSQPDSRFPKNFEKNFDLVFCGRGGGLWCSMQWLAVPHWQPLKGILKFPKNEIEVCENKEFSHFFIQIPFYTHSCCVGIVFFVDKPVIFNGQ